MTDREINVSVIITAYNSENELPRSIESVLNQEFQNIELIVIDDGSKTSKCKHIVHGYANDSSIPIRYFYQTNQGPSAARNLGIRMARGEYISFLDSDDEYKPNKLKVQYQLLSELPLDYAFISGGAEIIVDNKKIIRNLTIVDGFVYPDIIYNSYYGMNGTPGHLFRREVLLKIMYDESLRNHEDRDLMIRITQKYKIMTHSEIVSTIYKTNNTLSTRNPKLILENVLYFYDKLEYRDPMLSKVFINGRRQRAYFSASKLYLVNEGDFDQFRHLFKLGISMYGYPDKITIKEITAIILANTGFLGRVITNLFFKVKKRRLRRSH